MIALHPHRHAFHPHRQLPVLVALLLAPSLLVWADEPAAEPSFERPEVKRAWEKNGEDGVKDWMRAMVKRSKKAGLKIASTGKKPKCGSCHDNLKTYPLLPNAHDDLRELLEAQAEPSP